MYLISTLLGPVLPLPQSCDEVGNAITTLSQLKLILSTGPAIHGPAKGPLPKPAPVAHGFTALVTVKSSKATEQFPNWAEVIDFGKAFNRDSWAARVKSATGSNVITYGGKVIAVYFPAAVKHRACLFVVSANKCQPHHTGRHWLALTDQQEKHPF